MGDAPVKNGVSVKWTMAIIGALVFGPTATVGVGKIWPSSGKACPAHEELAKRVGSIESNRFTNEHGKELQQEVVELTINARVGDEKHKQVLDRLSKVEESLVNLTAAIRALEQKVDAP